MLLRHRPGLVALALLLAATAAARAQTEAQPRLETTVLQAGMHLIHAELARTPQQTTIGLMYRRELGANDGMLFVFPDRGLRCFWMRNTLLPLSIAFIDDHGTITDLADMKPLSEDEHCSTQAVRFALEMNQGWFAKRGIRPGFKLKGAPFAR